MLPRYSTPAQLILAALSIVSCSDAPTAPSDIMSMRVVEGGEGSDTVLALAPNALIIEVRDLFHGPAPGVPVRFYAVPPRPADTTAPLRSIYVCGVARGPCATFSASGYDVTYGVDVLTDASGLARARVQFGVVAGPGTIRVSLPDQGITVPLQFTTRAGALAKVLATVPDTAVYVGHTYAVGARPADRFGNGVPASVNVTTSTPGVIRVADGRVAAIGLGRGVILMHAGTITDTAHVSVPPAGRLVTFGWAPDYTTLTQLTLINTDGSGRRLLLSTITNSGYALPVWTPDGSHIVYENAGPAYRGELHLTDTLGGKRVLLSDPGNFSMSIQPAFSANGAGLYFFGEWDSTGVSGIYRANADGTHSQFLFGAVQPAPSPDGARVAYVSGDSLFSRDLTTGGVTPLASRPVLPHWSPTNDLIAFVGASDGSVQVVQSDGGNLRTLATGGFDQMVSWSPDGQWVAAAGWSGGVVLIRVADGARLPIPGTRDLYQPAWRP